MSPSWRRPFAELLAGALALGLLAGCGGNDGTSSGPRPPQEAPAGDPFFGVNGDQLYQLALHGQVGTLGAQARAIGAGGISFVRAPVNWGQIEPAPAADPRSFNFAISDSFAAALAVHHIRWDLIGQGVPTPAWAAGPRRYADCGFRSAPAKPGGLAILMAALTSRYGRDGSFWKDHPELPYLPITTYEIWNEPNGFGFWCPRPDPRAYAGLYFASAKAIHTVDPKATVVAGGLAGFATNTPAGGAPLRMTPRDFVAAAFGGGGHPPIDAVGIHPYAPTPAGVMAEITGFRQSLSESGLGDVPMSVNEVGWPTVAGPGLPATSESDRAAYLTDITTEISRRRDELGVLDFAPYTWTEAAGGAPVAQRFGMANPQTGEPLPSGRAYLDAVRSLSAR